MLRNVPGIELGASFRLLTHIAALIVRKDKNLAKRKLRDPLPVSLLSDVFAELQEDLPLYGGEQNFLQIANKNGSVSRGKNPAFKLSPTAPGENSQSYWDFSKKKPDTLPSGPALLALLIFRFYSSAGNSKFENRKCQNGSPGIRFVGAGNTSTEVLVQADTLWESLLASVPKSWVEGEGLPAWADPTGERSLSDGKTHPLWRASWMSNSVCGFWEDGELTGVGIGGTPPEHFVSEIPSPENKDPYKEWCDQRNTEDPFYLYVRDSRTNALKVKRLDLSKDLTELAVEWARDQTAANLENHFSNSVLPPRFKHGAALVFIRHQIGGNASTPLIRESVVTQTSDSLWCLDQDPFVQRKLVGHAEFIFELERTMLNPFRRMGKNDKYPTFDDLADLREVAKSAFWRHITPVYEEIITTVKKDDFDQKAVWKKAVEAAVQALNSVVDPYLLQNPKRNIAVQNQTRRNLYAKLREK
ncbi:MAG: type I-E CRISPR-associated protein Cse1/CasA [Corynebacterium sp.]|uniref:type I-E CRISPR-associated protein Cse1/CasA n=1 Tax=Corynebacterium sp. TaxID=1720 RepID=UPI0026DA7F04|nr:type I-E CRISPR-associated protein Cse1/CasA [Corynebacterium sp.]MDO4762323.1 type I-E CRISPR-associated protein Cse1/CasA [Corynebacterium sp.]